MGPYLPRPLWGHLGVARLPLMGMDWRALAALDRRRPWLLDAGLALALFLGAVAATAARPGPLPWWARTLLLAAAAAPLAWRRVVPLAALALSVLAVLVLLVLGESTAVIGSGLFLGAYTVAATRPLRATLVAAAGCMALLAAVGLLRPERMGLGETATNLALFVGAFTLGAAARSHGRTSELLAERAELAERARLEDARNAVTEERLRIARELHDVVGHSLGAIALQAGVGAHVVDTDPAEAKAALLAISERSRASLQEIRQMLGALREQDEELQSSPGLADVDRLVAQCRSAGLAVDVARSGEPWPLPAAMDLTAFRVLQEALTNVLRHSGTRTARVGINYGRDSVELSVADDGRGDTGAGSGHGQLGMRERVAVWGGSLRMGNRAGGGYEVVATLPRAEEAG